MTFARTAFILAAIPFTLIAVLWLLLSAGSFMSDNGWVFALCGGTFIFGSISALRGELPLSYLVFVGLVLNLIGACVWIPALGYKSGSAIGFVGASLSMLWAVAVYSAYRNERH